MPNRECMNHTNKAIFTCLWMTGQSEAWQTVWEKQDVRDVPSNVGRWTAGYIKKRNLRLRLSSIGPKAVPVIQWSLQGSVSKEVMNIQGGHCGLARFFDFEFVCAPVQGILKNPFRIPCTVCPILLGQVKVGQRRHCKCAKWHNSWIKVNNILCQTTLVTLYM